MSVSPTEITIEKGDAEVLEWVFFDSSPTTYLVSDNDNAYDNGVWNSGEPIKVELDKLTPGTHNIKITVQNSNGFFVTDTVIVTVTGSTNTGPTTPTSTTSSADMISVSSLLLLFVTLAVIFLPYTRKIRK